MALSTHIGTAVRTLRKEAGLTIDETCELAGVGHRYLSQVETGVVVPSPKWVALIAEALGEEISKRAAA